MHKNRYKGSSIMKQSPSFFRRIFTIFLVLLAHSNAWSMYKSADGRWIDTSSCSTPAQRAVIIALHTPSTVRMQDGIRIECTREFRCYADPYREYHEEYRRVAENNNRSCYSYNGTYDRPVSNTFNIWANTEFARNKERSGSILDLLGNYSIPIGPVNVQFNAFNMLMGLFMKFRQWCTNTHPHTQGLSQETYNIFNEWDANDFNDYFTNIFDCRCAERYTSEQLDAIVHAYPLYQFEGFLEFVTWQAFGKACELQREYKTSSKLQRQLEDASYGVRSAFIKGITQICNGDFGPLSNFRRERALKEIQRQENIVQKPVDHFVNQRAVLTNYYQKFANNEWMAETVNSRLAALNAEQIVSEKKYIGTLSSSALYITQICGHNVTDYESCKGPAFAHFLHNDCLNILNAIAATEIVTKYHTHVLAIADINYAGCLTIKKGKYLEASMMIDCARAFAHTIRNAAVGIIAGAFEGIDRTLDFIKDPTIPIKGFASIVCAAGYGLYSISSLLFHEGKNVYNGVHAPLDPEKSDLYKAGNRIYQFCSDLQYLTARDVTQEVTALIVDTVATGYLLKGISHFAGTARNVIDNLPPSSGGLFGIDDAGNAIAVPAVDAAITVIADSVAAGKYNVMPLAFAVGVGNQTGTSSTPSVPKPISPKEIIRNALQAAKTDKELDALQIPLEQELVRVLQGMPYATPEFIEYYIFMRIEIEKFCRQTNGGMIDRNTLIDLLHICTMDIEHFGRADATFKGLHWDPNGRLEKSSIFQEIIHKKMHPSGAYELNFKWNNKMYTKTFFPQHWTMKDLFNAIKDVYNNGCRKNGKFPNTKDINGIFDTIDIFINLQERFNTHNKVITTYPNLDKFFKSLMP